MSPDLLRRIEQPSALGPWSYIPIECKLASKPKTTFLVQASAYCELLTPLLGSRPDHFELYLGGGRFQRKDGVRGSSCPISTRREHQRDVRIGLLVCACVPVMRPLPLIRASVSVTACPGVNIPFACAYACASVRVLP